MSSKEIGFLFRIAVSCMLDSTKSVRLGEPDTVISKIIPIILNHLDLVETEDIMRMYSMIHSYFNSADVCFADSITVEEFIDIYQRPSNSEKYMSFSDLLMQEVMKRTK